MGCHFGGLVTADLRLASILYFLGLLTLMRQMATMMNPGREKGGQSPAHSPRGIKALGLAGHKKQSPTYHTREPGSRPFSAWVLRSLQPVRLRAKCSQLSVIP